jgi:hypothetical protein
VEGTDPDPALERLSPLVGEWTVEGSHSFYPSLELGGRAAFEWLEGGGFLIQRSTIEHPEFPNAVSIIGRDAEADGYSMHYFDSRGVHRIYAMSLSDGVWKLWRDGHPFPQRFTGTFSDDGNTIAGRWEKADESSNWETDFDLTYRKDA